MNSMHLEIAGGIITAASIVLFVALNIIHFNKHLKDRVTAH